MTDERGKRWSFDQFVRSTVPKEAHSRIEFLGQLNIDAVTVLRPKCYITIIASQQEMMPYSVLEAMSFGCPIVSNCGWWHPRTNQKSA